MKIFAKLLVIFSMFILFIGCKDEPETKVEPLRVGSALEFAPFDFQTPDDRNYQGFDIDLIRAIGKKMGRDVKISNLGFESGFDGLIAVLQTKNIDLFIAGMTITDERRQKVLFSDPYFKSGLAIAIRADDSSVNSFQDLAGKRIAVLIDTTGNLEAQKIPNVTIKEFGTPTECFEELAKNQVDAVINDRPVTDYMIHRGEISNVKVLPELLTEEEYGIAIEKDNVELMLQVNLALQQIRDSGEYDRIYEKWFGAKHSES